jgi:TetR/AcrR family transcriptional repressor of nem operon
MGRHALVDRDTALERIMRRFWLTGYAATSLDDLLDGSGMHRGSFYRTFGDKRRAFDAALERYIELIATEDIRPNVEGRASSTRRLIRLLHARLDTVLGVSSTAQEARRFDEPDPSGSGAADARPGCLVVNTALELAPHEAATRVLVGESFAAVRDVIAVLVQCAVDEGNADPRLDVALASERLSALLLGATVLAGAGGERRRLRRLLEQSVRTTLKPTASEGSFS